MKFDIRNQLINNTYIFKENLKLIALKIGKCSYKLSFLFIFYVVLFVSKVIAKHTELLLLK